MKTRRVMAVTLGLLAMSGLSWGHGSAAGGKGRDAVEPPSSIEHSRVDLDDSGRGRGHGGTTLLEARIQKPIASSRMASPFAVGAFQAVAVAPVPTPVIVILPPVRRMKNPERLTLPTVSHQRLPIVPTGPGLRHF